MDSEREHVSCLSRSWFRGLLCHPETPLLHNGLYIQTGNSLHHFFPRTGGVHNNNAHILSFPRGSTQSEWPRRLSHVRVQIRHDKLQRKIPAVLTDHLHAKPRQPHLRMRPPFSLAPRVRVIC